ncbi:NUDIX domain-containing protein [Kitasatospora acidiphila]|uniref:NUDIX domain-containing protein n=1 Tax=Kitasatospora acidiphila TaxID=2567942 RepID=A0A540W618_9ACTN|nr:NUDIX domain-containing protein [Kitasatospora acidiphila]TQF04475.1 NUDIX domain-containing protein [Kitasatospora acidiphila]
MAHNDIDAANQPRRRIGCVVLVTNADGDVLGVQTTYKPKPILPGGAARQGERSNSAGSRELFEETGIRRDLTGILAFDQTPANPATGATEGFNVVFNGGMLTDAEAAALSVPVDARDEIDALVWLPRDRLNELCEPYQARRIRQALYMLDRGQELPVLFAGEPAA